MKKVFSSLLVLGIAFLVSGFVSADILEKEVRSSDGKGSTKGYVYQHDRSAYRNTGRSRSSRDPVISENPVMIQVAPISQFTSDTKTPEVVPRAEGPKPRFGYGSDFQSSRSQKAPLVSPEKPRMDSDGKSAPVPPSTYQDSDVSVVPSYSDPNPSVIPRSESQLTPDSEGRIEPNPSYRDSSPTYGESPKIVGELLRALPSILDRREFAPREVETRHLEEWAAPAIEFNIHPRVNRESYPVLPHFVDPWCGTGLSTPFGNHAPFGIHGHHPFGGGFLPPSNYTPHCETPFPIPFCLPFGH